MATFIIYVFVGADFRKEDTKLLAVCFKATRLCDLHVKCPSILILRCISGKLNAENYTYILAVLFE